MQAGALVHAWRVIECAVAVMDEPDATAPGYVTNDPLKTGLGPLPYTIIPHHESDHPEAPAASEAVGWARDHGVEYVALRDGEVIVENQGRIEILPKLYL